MTVSVGLEEGVRSEAFLDRLWPTPLLWLAPANLVVVFAPLWGTSRPGVVVFSRVAFALIGTVSFALMAWLAVSYAMEDLFLLIAAVTFVFGWTGTVATQWVVSRTVPG